MKGNHILKSTQTPGEGNVGSECMNFIGFYNEARKGKIQIRFAPCNSGCHEQCAGTTKAKRFLYGDGLALSIGPNWVGFIWRRRQNSSLRNVVFWKINRTVFSEKDRTMKNVQKHNIQFNYLLFMCLLNSCKASYRHSTVYM
jgi:hypothetical protein